MKIRSIFIPAILLCMLGTSSCQHTAKTPAPSFPKNFPAVQIPPVITEREASMKYAAERYWNAYADSARIWASSDDSTRIGGVSNEVIQGAFAEYVQLLWQIPVQDALTAQSNTFDRIESIITEGDSCTLRVFETFVRMCEEIIYGANSDFRNEEFYIPILERLIATDVKSDFTIPIMKQKYAEDLAECSKNRIGEKAADFRFRTADGKEGTLRSVKADKTLLFFSNPGCHACLEIINSLKDSENVSAMISSGRLKVLNIYIDEDLKEWFNYMPVYPKEWINAYQYDLKVRKGGLYNVRAIPSLYLLDSEKRVILKDAAPQVVFNFL